MKYIFLCTILLFIVSGCGFKVVKQSEESNFKIVEIKTTGNNRINFNIKNKLLSNSKSDGIKLVSINLNTTKTKSIKERNIQNEITKYQIYIKTDIEFTNLNEKKITKFQLSKNGDYAVEKQYSQTLNNERNLVRNLSNILSEEILREIIVRFNDI